MNGRKVLICPLNWGLGHAARCIPIAREFISQNFSVDFAGDGEALFLLQKEFPDSRFFSLPGYNITYPSSGMMFNIGRKFASLLTTIRKEHRTVEEIVKEERYDYVLSDNRYGCYTSSAFSIFITHQIHIIAPFPGGSGVINRANHYFIEKYNQCWIPDFPQYPGLTGRLGHGHSLTHTRYIGPVSRMSPRNEKIKYRVTAILSGPEPQRSKWEAELLVQLRKLPFRTALVSGKIRKNMPVTEEENLTRFSFLTSEKLNKLIAVSEVIVCRGGYSSIMDLAAMQKKAICIPTPGQTEQQYLAKLYEEKKYFQWQTQKEMDLAAALERISEYSGIPQTLSPELLIQAIRDLSDPFDDR